MLPRVFRSKHLFRIRRIFLLVSNHNLDVVLKLQLLHQAAERHARADEDILFGRAYEDAAASMSRNVTRVDLNVLEVRHILQPRHVPSPSLRPTHLHLVSSFWYGGLARHLLFLAPVDAVRLQCVA